MSELEKEIKDKKYTQYADDILSGKIPSCKYVKMACERYLSWFEKDDRYFDTEAVEKVITFISKLKHFTGKYNNQPFLLEPWQKFIIYNLFGWKKRKDNLRLIRNFYLELGRKNGKALDISTKIPTPNGYTTMGDLKVGDEVFDKDGNITKVTFVTPIKYNHKCYEVAFSDGEKIIADEEHNWLVDRWHKNNFHVETTKEIIDKGYIKHKGTTKYMESYVSVPLAKPLEYEEKPLPFDPYTFGVWLGDGTSKKPELSLNGDDMEEILSYIPYTPTEIKQERDSNCYRVNFTKREWKDVEFSKFLIEHNLRGNKHIPKEFLYNSYNNRLALLQGLMDTDGYVGVNNKNHSTQCEIQQLNTDIAKGICFLLSSLGIKYNCRRKTPTINGKKCNEVWRISFNGDKTIPIFRLKRKLNLLPNIKGKKNVKYIKDIKEVKSVPVRCITVDSPSHTYLCGEKMTVTHNTSLVAAIFLYLLICDGEANPSLILSANSFRQSQIMYSMCSNYLRSIDQKGKYFRRYRDRILFPKNDGKIQTVASEPQKLDGENCSAFACDELHEAVDSKMWDVLATSCGSRDQSLGVAVTTAGFNKNGYCYQFRKSNIEVLEGKKTDDTLFCLIYTLDDEDDWCDESNWIKANPNLNVSVKEEFIEQQVNQAQNNPTQEVSVRTKLLNQWLDSSSSWIPMSFVDKSFAKVELEEFRDEYCYVGVDLGSVSDLTAVSVMIPKDDKIYVKNWAFVPEAAMDGTPNSMRYRQFRNQGDLIVTDGNVCDYDRIIKLLEEIQEVCPIRKIAYDQWNATQWAIEMTEKGFPLLPFSQSISSMNRPIKELQRLFLQGKIILDNNQVTRFCLGNCVAVIDNHENVALGKESYEQKIDVAVAMADAVGAYLSENHYDGSLIDSITF